MNKKLKVSPCFLRKEKIEMKKRRVGVVMKKYLKYGDHIQPRLIRVLAHNTARIIYITAEIPLPEHLKSEFRLDNCSRIKMKRRKK